MTTGQAASITIHDHHHDHSHAHGHSHGHAGHSHAPDNFGAAFAIGAALNAAFVIAELIFGYAANSLALISDAVHNLSDVVALLLAWGAAWLAQRQPTDAHLWLPPRLDPGGAVQCRPVAGRGRRHRRRGDQSLACASAGRGLDGSGGRGAWHPVNGGTALLFMRGRQGDLNIRGAYLHMAADAGVSLGVVGAALVIMSTGWLWLDPVTSLVIAAVVFWSGWGLARDSVNLALDGVPRGIDLGDVKTYLGGLDGVSEVHDLHIWAMSTNETALTAHLVRPGGHDDAFLHAVCEGLSHRFNIHHATLQVEASGEVCKLAPVVVRLGSGPIN